MVSAHRSIPPRVSIWELKQKYGACNDADLVEEVFGSRMVEVSASNLLIIAAVAQEDPFSYEKIGMIYWCTYQLAAFMHQYGSNDSPIMLLLRSTEKWKHPSRWEAMAFLVARICQLPV